MSDTATAPEPATTSPSPASPGASRGRLASHAAIYTVATAAPALAALLVLPFITRLLPEDEMNLVSLGNQVIQVGLILVALGMAAAITREYFLAGTGPEGARGLVMQSAVICVAITALGLTSGPLWVPLIMDAPWSWPFAWAVLAALGGSLVFVSQSYLRGAERPMAFVALAAGGTLLGPALGLVAVATLEATATAYLACVAGGYLAAGLAGLVIVWRSGPATYSLTALWHALKLGLPTVPHSAALTGVVAGLVVIAERRLDAAATAQVILTLGAGATMLIGAVNNAWAPLIFSTVKERRLAVLDETSRAITYLMAAVVVAVALGSSVLVHLAAPATFDRAQMIPAVAIAALAAIPSVPYFASSHLLLVHAQTGWLALTTPTAFAGAMALGWWLTGQWGIVGIGVAYAAAWLLLGVLTTLAQRTAGEDKWWPKPHLLALAAVAVAAVAGAWLPTDLPGVALRAALAAALALPLLWRTYRLVRGKR